MPGLPPSSPRGVTRNESTRSDSSAASNTSQSSACKKVVSFNKAVRVKKYPRAKRDKSSEGDGGKRFWFRVYKNKHRQSPDPGEFHQRVIYYGNENNNGYHSLNDHHDDVISYHPNPSALNYPPSLTTSECGTQTPGRSGKGGGAALLGNEFTPLHPSQMPTDPPPVRRNHVKKIVNRFNEEAVFQRQRSFSEGDNFPSPPGSPKLHSTPKHVVIPVPPPPPPPPPVIPPPGYETDRSPPPEGLFASRLKKNPIVNGVKVMFGMGANSNNKKGEDSSSHEHHGLLNGKPQNRGLFKTEIVISDGSETDVKTPYVPGEKFLYGDYHHQNNSNGNGALVKRGDKFDVSTRRNGDEGHSYYNYYDDEEGDGRRSKYHVETWDSGNQLLFDTSDLNTATSKTDKGEFVSTVGEKHQLWRNNKRVVVYEEPSPTVIRRKAKSQSDLTHSEEKYPYDDKLDKGVSTDELFVRKPSKKDTLSKKSKDAWLGTFKSSTKDKGIQCSKIPLDEPEELYGFGRYKIIRPRNGVVSAFSNASDKTKSQSDAMTNGKDSSVIYSQVDKSKKKKNSEKKKSHHLFSEEGRLGSLFKSRSEPLYIGPPPSRSQQQPDDDDLDDLTFFEERPERVVKTSKKSFGFKLGAAKDISSRNHNNSNNSYEEQDWYNIDGDVEAHQRQFRTTKGSHRDIAEVRQELLEEETDVSSLSNNGEQQKRGAGSVVRELDYRKREISYENVPGRPGGDDSDRAHEQQPTPGLWYREADEDYRKEMAQSEVSYPAGNSVGSDRFYTIDNRRADKERSRKLLPPPSPRAYTLDRRHLTRSNKEQQVRNTSGVKILVNGKEVKETKKTKKKTTREDPSSVQSDPLCGARGGLAAAYQARQRANVRRSNSTASGLSNGNSKYRGGSPNVRRIVSSEISAASSESESGRVRRPLVMYIPGVSHPDHKASEGEDRVSSSIARSHSVMSPTRPPRVLRRSGRNNRKKQEEEFYEEEEEDMVMPLASERGHNRKKPPRVPADSRKQSSSSDIKRRHSMPKDTKFSWLKWRIRGKPSREP